jgi:bacteriocin leader peptide (microcyclamide/patellamide family)
MICLTEQTPARGPPLQGHHSSLDSKIKCGDSTLNLTLTGVSMNNKIISPNPKKPVDRASSGQLPTELAELCEESLSMSAEARPSYNCGGSGVMLCLCSVEAGDD